MLGMLCGIKFYFLYYYQMKVVTVIIGSALGGVSGFMLGIAIGQQIYTGPHKYGIITTALGGGIAGTVVGGYVGARKK